MPLLYTSRTSANVFSFSCNEFGGPGRGCPASDGLEYLYGRTSVGSGHRLRVGSASRRCPIPHPAGVIGNAPAVAGSSLRTTGTIYNSTGLLALFQDEGYGHVDLLARDVPVLDHDVHVLDPGTLDVAEGAGSTVDALVYRVLEALIGRGAQLGNSSYRHNAPFPRSPLKTSTSRIEIANVGEA